MQASPDPTHGARVLSTAGLRRTAQPEILPGSPRGGAAGLLGVEPLQVAGCTEGVKRAETGSNESAGAPVHAACALGGHLRALQKQQQQRTVFCLETYGPQARHGLLMNILPQVLRYL